MPATLRPLIRTSPTINLINGAIATPGAPKRQRYVLSLNAPEKTKVQTMSDSSVWTASPRESSKPTLGLTKQSRQDDYGISLKIVPFPFVPPYVVAP